MTKYRCIAEVYVEAKDEDDVQVELSHIMDAHDISWDVERVED
jgi:hypothetical protein